MKTAHATDVLVCARRSEAASTVESFYGCMCPHVKGALQSNVYRSDLRTVMKADGFTHLHAVLSLRFEKDEHACVESCSRPITNLPSSGVDF